MRVLFLTIGAVYNFDNRGAYTDLLKRFQREGHDVYVVGAIEKRIGRDTEEAIEHGIHVLRVKVGNITKTNLFEKGISTLTIGKRYLEAIDRFWRGVSFDLILYTTPPITIAGLVKKLRARYGAYAYLLLKDIFPQNAIDIGILRKTGWKGIVYRYFKHVEKKLYGISDKIGCMSKANVDFVLKNSDVDSSKVEVCPNTIDVIPKETIVKSDVVLKKYGIPTDKFLLLYGGNFGKPQNVDYIIESLKLCSTIPNIHFVLCGSGTDFYKIEEYLIIEEPTYVSVIKQLPYEEYAKLVASCHLGLLFLDYRFTIPNFPSRLLDYMNYGLPVIAATDVNTDVGKVIQDGDFGWWCESKNNQDFAVLVENIFNHTDLENTLEQKSKNARKYLKEEYETGRAYTTIMNAYRTKK